MERTVQLTASIEAKLTGVARMRVDWKSPERHNGRPAEETRTGCVQQANGEWWTIERVVDRANDLYTERLYDVEGTLVKDFTESLHEHTERGSAKRL